MPQHKLGIFENIVVLKVTLQSVRLLLTVSYTKKSGQQDVLVAPTIILLGDQLVAPPSCSPCSTGSGAYVLLFARKMKPEPHYTLHVHCMDYSVICNDCAV